MNVSGGNIAVEREAAVAMDQDGDFVTVWNTDLFGNPAGETSGRRYTASGSPLGGRFVVGLGIGGAVGEPDVAMSAQGAFVVTWTGGDVLDPWGISAQRYDSNGVQQDLGVVVNNHADGFQQHPAISMDPTGDYVIVWQGDGPSGNAVYGQRFDSAGARLGGQFFIGEYYAGFVGNVDVAMDADGDFVVTWAYGESGGSVHARLFIAAGSPRGSAFPVADLVGKPSVGMDHAGNFVIASSGRVQRYDAAGVPQGSPVTISTTPPAGRPHVGSDADGDFAISWLSGSEAYTRRFNAAGVPQGPAVLVNPSTPATSDLFVARATSIAVDADGDAVVTWSHHDGTIAAEDVYFRRFRPGPNPDVSVNGTFVTEGDSGTKNASFTVLLSHASVGPTRVHWETRDAAAGTRATAGADYTASSGVLEIAAGQTSGVISVPVLGDTRHEAHEFFDVVLTAAEGATIADGTASATISNDDATPTVVGRAGRRRRRRRSQHHRAGARHAFGRK